MSSALFRRELALNAERLTSKRRGPRFAGHRAFAEITTPCSERCLLLFSCCTSGGKNVRYICYLNFAAEPKGAVKLKPESLQPKMHNVKCL